MGVTVKRNEEKSSLNGWEVKSIDRKKKSEKIFKIKLDNTKKALTFATP